MFISPASASADAVTRTTPHGAAAGLGSITGVLSPDASAAGSPFASLRSPLGLTGGVFGGGGTATAAVTAMGRHHLSPQHSVLPAASSPPSTDALLRLCVTSRESGVRVAAVLAAASIVPVAPPSPPASTRKGDRARGSRSGSECSARSQQRPPVSDAARSITSLVGHESQLALLAAEFAQLAVPSSSSSSTGATPVLTAEASGRGRSASGASGAFKSPHTATAASRTQTSVAAPSSPLLAPAAGALAGGRAAVSPHSIGLLVAAELSGSRPTVARLSSTETSGGGGSALER